MTLRAGTRRTLLALSLAVCVSPALADIPITITATIVAPVCKVTDTSGGGRMEVDFGLVQLTEVNTAQAEQPVPLKVSCEGPSPGTMALKLRMTPGASGTMSVAGKTVLKTSRTGLGIDLQMAGNTVAPDTWVAVNGVDTTVPAPEGALTLQARLVADTPASLGTGDFTATANLTLAYQ